MFVLDACFSGMDHAGHPLVSAQLSVPVDFREKHGKKRQRPRKRARRDLVFSATARGQYTSGLPGANRPAYSYLLLGALRGWADADNNGVVTAGEAQSYISKVLKNIVVGREQTPQLRGARARALSRGPLELGPAFALRTRDDAGAEEEVRSLRARVQRHLRGRVFPRVDRIRAAWRAYLKLAERMVRSDKRRRFSKCAGFAREAINHLASLEPHDVAHHEQVIAVAKRCLTGRSKPELPPTTRSVATIRLTVALTCRTETESGWSQIAQCAGAPLPVGTQVAPAVRTSRAGHVYLVNSNDRGELNIVYPAPGEPSQVSEDTWSRVPPADWLDIQEDSAPVERLLVVASARPVPELEALLGRALAPDSTELHSSLSWVRARLRPHTFRAPGSLAPVHVDAADFNRQVDAMTAENEDLVAIEFELHRVADPQRP